MGLKDKLGRIARRAEERRAASEIEDAFAVNMERLEAQIRGEAPPPAHPISLNPRYAGTFLAGEQAIVDEGGEPLDGAISDLSE